MIWGITMYSIFGLFCVYCTIYQIKNRTDSQGDNVQLFTKCH